MRSVARLEGDVQQTHLGTPEFARRTFEPQAPDVLPHRLTQLGMEDPMEVVQRKVRRLRQRRNVNVLVEALLDQ